MTPKNAGNYPKHTYMYMRLVEVPEEELKIAVLGDFLQFWCWRMLAWFCVFNHNENALG